MTKLLLISLLGCILATGCIGITHIDAGCKTTSVGFAQWQLYVATDCSSTTAVEEHTTIDVEGDYHGVESLNESKTE